MECKGSLFNVKIWMKILVEKGVHYAMETKIEIGIWRDNEMNIKDF